MKSQAATFNSPLSSTSWRWWVCGALFLATLLNYMDRLALSQTATELKERYGIGNARYGTIERNFSWAFAAGSVVFGFIADRLGPRLVYPIVLLGWSIAGLITPLIGDPNITGRVTYADDPAAGPYNWLLLCRTMLGFFEAGHWPCALLTARQILTTEDRPLGNGILQSGAPIGAILTPIYVMGVRHAGFGWEVVFWTIGAAGLLWVPLWLGLVGPGDLKGKAKREEESEGEIPPSSKQQSAPAVLAFIRMFVTLFLVIIGLTISWQFVRAWLPMYLKESQGFSADATDPIVSCYYITSQVGCLAAGFLVRRLVARGKSVDSARIIGFAVFATITLSAALVPVVGGGWAGVGLLCLAGAGILGLHPYYYALAQELPSKHMGSLSGLLAAMGWFVAGYVQKELGKHIEATNSYDAGFVLAGVAPLLGLFALVTLWKRQ